MMSDGKQQSALVRRWEQLKRWEDSETNRLDIVKKDKLPKVKFQEGCVFLAACAAGDPTEVLSLLNKGADPNTANVDGLTALHQSCIDDNIKMVEFLVQHGADINVADNEGWTPLHATASCGYMDIARFLVDHGCLIAAVNSDGDLPIDIAEGEDMEQFLAKEMHKRDIDADTARGEEERMMLVDANNWLQSPKLPELAHPKTGATALHIASAKGYLKVMAVLLQAGANINQQDFDGWTSLHAAAHWGQEEACKLLAEALCDMEIKDNNGQTAEDVADENLVKLIVELKEKQVSLRSKERKDSYDDVILQRERQSQLRRRSSVTRISQEDKKNLAHQNSVEEAAVLTSEDNQLVEEADDNVNEADNDEKWTNSEIQDVAKMNVPDKRVAITGTVAKEPAVVTRDSGARRTGSVSDEATDPKAHTEVAQGKGSIVPTAATLPTETDDRFDEFQQTSRHTSSPDQDIAGSAASLADPSTWRSGLRKTPSTGAVPDNAVPAVSPVQRSASSNLVIGNDEKLASPATVVTRRAFAHLREEGAAVRATTERASYPAANTTTAYIPYYKRKQLERENKEREEKEQAERNKENSIPGSSNIPSVKEAIREPLDSTVSGSGSTSNTPTTPERRLSKYEAPKRDEESETSRKMKAKRARETRRSTQGVTQEDVKAAEATLKVADTTSQPVESSTEIVQLVSNAETGPTDQTSELKDDDKQEETGRRRAWQRQSSADAKEDDATRSSFRKARDIISGSSAPVSVSEISATSKYVSRHQRNSMNDATADSSNDQPNRNSYLWRANERNGVGSEENAADDDDNRDKNREEDDKKPRSLRNKRNRRERRSTGVICYGENDAEKEEKDRDTTEDHAQNEQADSGLGWAAARYSNRRIASASDVPSQLSVAGSAADRSSATDRSSRYRRTQPHDSPTAQDSQDYKRLFEDMKVENDKLKQRISQLETELTDTKRNIDQSKSRSTTAVESLADKREKRTLERRISELEEELKNAETIKQDNARLKEENGALIRVISKLSK